MAILLSFGLLCILCAVLAWIDIREGEKLNEAAFKKILAGKGMPEHLQEEMLENMLLMPQFGYYGGESLKASHAVSFHGPCIAGTRVALPADMCIWLTQTCLLQL